MHLSRRASAMDGLAVFELRSGGYGMHLLSMMKANPATICFGCRVHTNVALNRWDCGTLARSDRQSAQNHNDFVTFDSTNKSVFNSNTLLMLATNFSNE